MSHERRQVYFKWQSTHVHKMIYHQATALTNVTRDAKTKDKTLTCSTLYQQVGHFMMYCERKHLVLFKNWQKSGQVQSRKMVMYYTKCSKP